jgi:hypothetical protein
MLDSGWFAEYSVEQIRYTAAAVGIPDSISFFRRYEALSYLPIQNNISALKVSRFQRSDSTQPWLQDSSFLFWQESTGIYQTAGAQVYFLLPALLKKGLQWNRNIRNNIGPNTTTLTAFSESRSIEGKPFDDTHFVQIERIPRNFVQAKNVYQIYAKGIGMVYNYSEDIAYAQGSLFGQFIPESGSIFKETLVRSGTLP